MSHFYYQSTCCMCYLYICSEWICLVNMYCMHMWPVTVCICDLLYAYVTCYCMHMWPVTVCICDLLLCAYVTCYCMHMWPVTVCLCTLLVSAVTMECRCLASLSAETNFFLWYFGVQYGRLFLRGKPLIAGVVKTFHRYVWWL